jgi:hypothetical protein
LLGRHISKAADVTAHTREALRLLLEEPIRFTPILEERRRGYQFRGAAKLGGILAGNVWGNATGVPGRI